MFASGEAIISPMGLFIAPRWDTPVELLLIALSPALVNRVAERSWDGGAARARAAGAPRR